MLAGVRMRWQGWRTVVGYRDWTKKTIKKVFFVFHIDVPRRGKAISCVYSE